MGKPKKSKDQETLRRAASPGLTQEERDQWEASKSNEKFDARDRRIELAMAERRAQEQANKPAIKSAPIDWSKIDIRDDARREDNMNFTSGWRGDMRDRGLTPTPEEIAEWAAYERQRYSPGFGDIVPPHDRSEAGRNAMAGINRVREGWRWQGDEKPIDFTSATAQPVTGGLSPEEESTLQNLLRRKQGMR